MLKAGSDIATKSLYNLEQIIKPLWTLVYSFKKGWGGGRGEIGWCSCIAVFKQQNSMFWKKEI